MDVLRPISSIMSTDLICLSPHNTIADVHDVFHKNRIHHIPIVVEDALVGMVSKADYLYFRKGFIEDKVDREIDSLRLSAYNVEQIMTTGLATLESNSRISVAIEIFKENLFHAIPIVDNEKLTGILTTFDIINELSVTNVSS